MVPFYAGRLADQRPGDLLEIERVCGHVDRLTVAMFATAGARPNDKLGDLAPWLQYRECDKRGKVAVSIKWAE